MIKNMEIEPKDIWNKDKIEQIKQFIDNQNLIKISNLNLPLSHCTKLDEQIDFMENMNYVIKTPITISILNSLKELKGIKQKQLENLKTK